MQAKAKAKSEKIDIRFSQQEASIIKQAASLQHTNMSNFVRQQAVGAAEAVIHDQTRFAVSAEQWNFIEAALERPAQVLPNLQKKLATTDDWDQ
jgi:uncharacterized protein (DUF1778 family)